MTWNKPKSNFFISLIRNRLAIVMLTYFVVNILFYNYRSRKVKAGKIDS